MRESEFMQTLQLRIGEDVAEELPEASSWSLFRRVGGGCIVLVLVLVCLFYRWLRIEGGLLGHGGCWRGHLRVCFWRQRLGNVEGYVLRVRWMERGMRKNLEVS